MKWEEREKGWWFGHIREPTKMETKEEIGCWSMRTTMESAAMMSLSFALWHSGVREEFTNFSEELSSPTRWKTHLCQHRLTASCWLLLSVAQSSILNLEAEGFYESYGVQSGLTTQKQRFMGEQMMSLLWIALEKLTRYRVNLCVIPIRCMKQNGYPKREGRT